MLTISGHHEVQVLPFFVHKIRSVITLVQPTVLIPSYSLKCSLTFSQFKMKNVKFLYITINDTLNFFF